MGLQHCFILVVLTFTALGCDKTKQKTCDADKRKNHTDAQKADYCLSYQITIDCAIEAGCDASCDKIVENKKTLGVPDSCEIKCTESDGCFPASGTVELEDHTIKSMDQLTIGDKVRVGPDAFSEVYFFSTSMSETTSKFVKISTGHTDLSLTAGHFLYANGKQMQARHIKAGDVISLGNGTTTPVISVGSVWGPGLFNPHTLHGDIVVDGIVTTTYTDAVHPKLAHALLMPLRALYGSGITFGEGFSTAVKGLPTWVLDGLRLD